MMRTRDAVPVGDVAGAVTNLVDHYERWGENRLRLLAQEDRIPVVAENVGVGAATTGRGSSRSSRR